MTAGRCPHCGSLVRVNSAGEGTCSYEPVAEQAIREALAVIEECYVIEEFSRSPSGRVRDILRRGLGDGGVG